MSQLPELKEWLIEQQLLHLYSALIEVEFDSIETLVMLNDEDIDELIVEIDSYLQQNNDEFTATQQTKFRTALLSQRSKYNKLMTRTNLSIQSYLKEENMNDNERMIKSSTQHLQFNVEIKNLFELFQSELNKQVINKTNIIFGKIFQYLFYQNYCSCCCIGYKPLEILQIIANKLSNKLKYSGYDHQLCLEIEKIKLGHPYSFTIILNETYSLTQMLFKHTMCSIIENKLNEAGVIAKIDVTVYYNVEYE